MGLASQLIMQRDTKQEGIHELELEARSAQSPDPRSPAPNAGLQH